MPEVVAQRVMRMWLAGAPLSHRDRDEFYGMFAEKFIAFYESWNAMALEMLRVSLTLGLFPRVDAHRAQPSGGDARPFPAGLAPSIAALRRTRSAFDARADRSRLDAAASVGFRPPSARRIAPNRLRYCAGVRFTWRRNSRLKNPASS